MKRLLGTISVVGIGASVLLASGCSSTGQTVQADPAAPGVANLAACASCEVVRVTGRFGHGPRNITSLQTEPVMSCPTCDLTARPVVLADGGLRLHDCPGCTVAPRPSAGPDRYFHPKKGISG